MEIVHQLLDILIDASALAVQHTQLLQLANAERTKLGMQSLVLNKELCRLALSKSQDMAEKNYFSHQSPTFGTAFDMMRSAGISYYYAGENLAIHQDAEKAHLSWMASETHRNNILNPHFNEIGIGIFSMEKGNLIYTQMFVCR